VFLSCMLVVPGPPALGGVQAAADEVLQTRHELLIPARPAAAGPRSQHAYLLLILRPQEGFPVAYAALRQRQLPAAIPVAGEHVVTPSPSLSDVMRTSRNDDPRDPWHDPVLPAPRAGATT